MNNIEILENKIQCFRHLQNTLDDDEKELFEDGIQQKEIEAIENLIQKNKELSKLLEEKTMRIEFENIENYIPKSKIEKALDKMNERYMTPEAISNSNGATFNYWTGKRDMCIELLEGE